MTKLQLNKAQKHLINTTVKEIKKVTKNITNLNRKRKTRRNSNSKQNKRTRSKKRGGNGKDYKRRIFAVIALSIMVSGFLIYCTDVRLTLPKMVHMITDMAELNITANEIDRMIQLVVITYYAITDPNSPIKLDPRNGHGLDHCHDKIGWSTTQALGVSTNPNTPAFAEQCTYASENVSTTVITALAFTFIALVPNLYSLLYLFRREPTDSSLLIKDEVSPEAIGSVPSSAQSVPKRRIEATAAKSTDEDFERLLQQIQTNSDRTRRQLSVKKDAGVSGRAIKKLQERLAKLRDDADSAKNARNLKKLKGIRKKSGFLANEALRLAQLDPLPPLPPLQALTHTSSDSESDERPTEKTLAETSPPPRDMTASEEEDEDDERLEETADTIGEIVDLVLNKSSKPDILSTVTDVFESKCNMTDNGKITVIMDTETLRNLLLHISKISLHQQDIREAVPPELLFLAPGPTIKRLKDKEDKEEDESSDVAANPNGGRKKKKQTKRKKHSSSSKKSRKKR